MNKYSVVIYDQSINKSKICMCGNSTTMRTAYLASCRRKFITKLFCNRFANSSDLRITQIKRSIC